MKHLRYSILMLILLISVSFNSFAQQRDNRNRVAETIIADGLVQLPAKDVKTFDQVIGEMASTGQKGIMMIADMLKPADQSKNAIFEYAINGITDYSLEPGKERLRREINDGLVAALEKCTDNANKAFLMTQIQKFADKKNVNLFVKYLKDDYLSDYAIRGLFDINGIDDVILNLMKENVAPQPQLAYLAMKKNIKAAEPILINWYENGDSKTKALLNECLAACGGENAAKVLRKDAKAVNFMPDPTRVTDAYIEALGNMTDEKTVNKLSRELITSANSSVRCSGLALMLATDGKNMKKDIVKALKSNDIEYRNTALTSAAQLLGNDAFIAVTDNFKALSPAAKTDVLRWLGNNKVDACTPVVINSLKNADANVVKAAIESASKIGGEYNLKALVGMLGSEYNAEVYTSLKTFNGNIANDITAALNSNDAVVLKNAITLASDRHIHSAYSKIKELALNGSNDTKEQAFNALKGVSTPENFDEICKMMENGVNAEALQNAAKASIQSLSNQEQYNKIDSKIKSSKSPALYYPLLAQAGTAEALMVLNDAYNKSADKEAAYKALLDVKNPQVAPILYNIAKNDASKKDVALTKFVALTKGQDANAAAAKYYSGKDAEAIMGGAVSNTVLKYQAYRRALELKPSDNLVKKILSNLSECRIMPALMLAANYLDNSACAYNAALTVKNIVNKNADLQGGQLIKDILVKAQNVCKAQTGNADAGYAVDEINGLLAKMSAEGYATLDKNDKAAAKFSSKESYENLELYFEYQTNAEGKLSLRSMPLYDLKVSDMGPNAWNTVYCKLINDRLFIENNGVAVYTNKTISEIPGLKKILNSGLIEINSTQSGFALRDLYVKKLPSTPVFTLSAEEKKQGFEVLFDGRSLEKWQGNTDAYIPTDGNIYVTAQYGGEGNLYTKKKYKDFIYRFEFCFGVPGVNNGIGVRTNIGSDAAYDGMEIQVLDHDDPIYKGLHPYQQHGSVYGIIVPKHITFGPIGTWNTEEIQVIGDHVKVTVNGQVITDGNIREACQGHNVAPDGSKTNPYTVDHNNHPGLFNPEGYISFCGHGPGVMFRNVRILDLSKKTNKKK